MQKDTSPDYFCMTDENSEAASHRKENGLTRREFTALAAAGLSAGALLPNPLYAVARNVADRVPPVAQVPLDLAEWSYFWVGVERAELARGTVVNGRQMYVEYMIPAQVKHPYPIVLVHGGTGQMLHYMGEGDGQAGWRITTCRRVIAYFSWIGQATAARRTIPTRSDRLVRNLLTTSCSRRAPLASMGSAADKLAIPPLTS
jgi:hypothetical protein